MMRFSKTVSANMLSIIFISLAAKVSRVAGFFLIAWALPASEIGRLSLVLASVEILSGLSDFGVDWIVIRRLSQEPEQRSQLVSSSVAAKLVLSAVAYALVVA